MILMRIFYILLCYLLIAPNFGDKTVAKSDEKKCIIEISR